MLACQGEAESSNAKVGFPLTAFPFVVLIFPVLPAALGMVEYNF